MNLHMIRAVRLVNAQQKGLPVADFIAALDDIDCSAAFDELMRRRGRKTWWNELGGYLSGLSFAERAALYEAGSAFSPLLEASLMADLAALSYAEQMGLLLPGSALGKLVALSLFGDPDAMAVIAASPVIMADIASSPTLMTEVLSSAVAISAIFAVPAAKSAIMASTALAVASVPKMTSDVAPSGAASAKTIYGAPYAAWLAFDGNDATFWNSAGAAAGEWIQYQFPADVFVHSMAVSQYGSAFSPKDCVLQKSVDGVTFVDVKAMTLPATGIASIDVASAGFCKYWRLSIANNYGAGYVALKELGFTGFVKP